MQKFSVAITTYNRFDLTIKSIEQVLGREEISEFIIYDDGSMAGIVCDLIDYYNHNYHPNVRIIININNVGMAMAKRNAVEQCKEDYVILFDSDNELSNEYIDSLANFFSTYDDYGSHKTIFMPSFARPTFDFRHFEGSLFNKHNVRPMVDIHFFGVLINTCNYVVPRQSYLDIWQPNPEIKGTDTAWFNYLWLKSGRGFYVVPGMEYNHLVHEGSTFMQHCDYNMQKAREIDQLIREL